MYCNLGAKSFLARTHYLELRAEDAIYNFHWGLAHIGNQLRIDLWEHRRSELHSDSDGALNLELAAHECTLGIELSARKGDEIIGLHCEGAVSVVFRGSLGRSGFVLQINYILRAIVENDLVLGLNLVDEGCAGLRCVRKIYLHNAKEPLYLIRRRHGFTEKNIWENKVRIILNELE